MGCNALMLMRGAKARRIFILATRLWGDELGLGFVNPEGKASPFGGNEDAIAPLAHLVAERDGR